MVDTVLICACEDPEHNIIVRYDPENKDKYVYVNIKLNPLPLWKRFTLGIKYIFGYKCRFGDYDEFILNEKHIDSLKSIIKYLKR